MMDHLAATLWAQHTDLKQGSISIVGNEGPAAITLLRSPALKSFQRVQMRARGAPWVTAAPLANK